MCAHDDAGEAAGGASARASDTSAAVSDTVCDLREYCGYESGTCDDGGSTTASEMSERVGAARGGHRRGKRAGRKTPSMRRAQAAVRGDTGAEAAIDGDE